MGGGGAGPVSAHSCSRPSLLTVGQPAVITVGVAAEAVAVDEVTILVPRQLRIDEVDEANGWKATRTEAAIAYRGGRIEPLDCFYFSLRGTPVSRGTYVLALQVHFEDGTEQTFRGRELGSLDSGHVIFAGTDPDAAAPSGTDPAQVAIIVAFAVVGAGVAIFVVRRALRP